MGALDRYPYAPAARAQMLSRLGRLDEAAAHWRRAAELARTAAERRHFVQRAVGSN
jgi:RNA polymerase sigma-70 factor (ECF subfamily)